MGKTQDSPASVPARPRALLEAFCAPAHEKIPTHKSLPDNFQTFFLKYRYFYSRFCPQEPTNSEDM